jgi:hypothetical protein
MTSLLTNPQSANPSPKDSWDDVAESLPEPVLTPAEIVPDTVANNSALVCVGCGLPIVREAGARGRSPKYHPDCRPKSAGARGATARSNKAGLEADECVEQFKKAVVKGCIILSMVDRFDAFTIMANLPQVCDNLHAILVRYEKFRKEWLAMKGGGSWIGLFLALVSIALPIAAHHGLVPSKKLAQVLANMPMTMFGIQQKLKDGEENLTKLMHDQMQAMRVQHEKQNAAPNGNP